MPRLRIILARASFLVAALSIVSIAAPLPAATQCAMSAAEAKWVDDAVSAWRYMASARLKIPDAPPPVIVVFDKTCRFEARATAILRWRAEPHGSTVRLPDGGEAPVRVTSFAGHDDKTGQSYFVMALPSIWEAANVAKLGDEGLKGVFLHEFSHTRQVPALASRFKAAAAVHKAPDDLDDDAIQRKFSKDPAYAAVAEKERDLLYDAAHQPDMTKALQLAAQALALIDARQKRWFTGEDAMWRAYDDIFLTMEGAGQWVAYAWLSDPNGGKMTAMAAEAKMRGKRNWWSQDEGLSLMLVLNRFMPDWPQRAFTSPGAVGIDMLRAAVAARAAR